MESFEPPADPGASATESRRPSTVARAKAQKQRLTERAATAREQLEDARHRSRAVDAAFGALEHDSEVGGGVLAAAVGFRVFLFLVPYVFVLVAGFGVASDASGKAPAAAARDAGIGGLIARTLGDFGSFSAWQRIAALAVGLFGLYLGARALVKTLVIIHDLVWRVAERRKVNGNKGAAVLVGMVTVALALTSAVGWLRGRSLAAGLVATIVFVAVPLGLWLLISWLLPHDADAPWWALLPGAVVLGVGIEVLHLVTVYWIAREVGSKAQTYGAIGAALAMLLWAYLLGRLIIASAVANATLWHRNVLRRQPAPGADVSERSERGPSGPVRSTESGQA